ncbi:MAG: calcium-translocating P-type ATPase, PMCA-type [Christensenellaceae bacterium]|jgi:calcium-translocating P-type ATPase|nr:calcium-translocating P-type ATPase, PMCA-type [Christensenellaceae bacterium]
MDGLNAAQVQASRQANGTNKLSRGKRVSIVRKFFTNFNDPMLKILLVALAINCIFIFRSDSLLETIGIAAAILIAVIVSTLSEQSSSKAFEKLQLVASHINVRVTREGKTMEIPIEDVVVGDIVHLFVGDKIPADGKIIKGQIEVDQSLINGESKEVQKKAVSGDEGFVYSGTVVTSGEATMRVTHVGDQTFYGKMAAELQIEQPKSPLKVKLEHLAKLISIIGYIGAVMVAGAYLCNALLLNGETFSLQHAIHAGTLIVSVIVMAVPEGLPMMITVVLASNMKHMLRDNVLVRKLNGIETAGSMNILFTDKTGTLTQGKLEVAQVITDDPVLLATILRFNNSAKIIESGRAVGGNFTDRILMEYSHGQPVQNVEVKEQTPFNSTVKYMKTVLTDGRTLLKGAPEVILAMSTGDHTKIKAQIADLTRKAFRLIACAVQQNTGSGVTLAGLVAIRDNVRPEAIIACDKMRSAGIQVVMITGDAKETAVAVARETKILKDEQVLTSAELAKLSDAEVRKILPNLRVVARALPSDKSRLVGIAQSLGLVAGMTGDGVNDAPALKSADVGFSMGSGTEVAKEAGDIVIMDDNIASVGNATSYGRTIFKSIRKFLIFKLTINFVAMSISIVAPFLGVGMPITVLQMLWINIVMDTLAGIAYGGERPHPSYMSESPKRRNEPIVNRYMWGQILYATLFISGLSLWFLMSSYVQQVLRIHGGLYAMTAFFAFFMFINIFNSFNSRTHSINLVSSMKLNKPFVFIMSIVTAAQVLLIFFGGDVFRTQPLLIKHFMVAIVLASMILPIDMLRKLFLQWKYGKHLSNT